ncbi:unnamed protein product, partial [Closterium sp. Yama58-4]
MAEDNVSKEAEVERHLAEMAEAAELGGRLDVVDGPQADGSCARGSDLRSSQPHDVEAADTVDARTSGARCLEAQDGEASDVEMNARDGADVVAGDEQQVDDENDPDGTISRRTRARVSLAQTPIEELERAQLAALLACHVQLAVQVYAVCVLDPSRCQVATVLRGLLAQLAQWGGGATGGGGTTGRGVTGGGVGGGGGTAGVEALSASPDVLASDRRGSETRRVGGGGGHGERFGGGGGRDGGEEMHGEGVAEEVLRRGGNGGDVGNASDGGAEPMAQGSGGRGRGESGGKELNEGGKVRVESEAGERMEAQGTSKERVEEGDGERTKRTEPEGGERELRRQPDAEGGESDGSVQRQRDEEGSRGLSLRDTPRFQPTHSVSFGPRGAKEGKQGGGGEEEKEGEEEGEEGRREEVDEGGEGEEEGEEGRRAGLGEVVRVRGEVAAALQPLAGAFDASLFPVVRPPLLHRTIFSPAEDCLLAMGVEQLSTDWEAIHRRFLPGKTPHQISIRWKNRCSSRVPDNPIKRVWRRKTAPLTDHEVDQIQT